MSNPDPRHYTQQREIARVTATIMARDPTQFAHHANHFKHALDRECTYLTTRHCEGVS
jgi:hypothetical protein